MIWLASFPRSGNTFARILLRENYGIPAPSLYSDDPAYVDASAVAALRRSPQLHFVKTHGLPCDDSPAILLMRDGRDALVSYAHFMEDYGLLDWSRAGRAVFELRARLAGKLFGRTRFEQLLRLVIANQGWSEHFHAWDSRGAPTAHLRFESLVADPFQQLESAVAELGFALPTNPPGARPPCFDCLRQRDPKFFRAGAAGQWRREMSPELQDFFWREHGAAMLAAGYER